MNFPEVIQAKICVLEVFVYLLFIFIGQIVTGLLPSISWVGMYEYEAATGSLLPFFGVTMECSCAVSS